MTPPATWKERWVYLGEDDAEEDALILEGRADASIVLVEESGQEFRRFDSYREAQLWLGDEEFTIVDRRDTEGHLVPSPAIAE